MNNTIETLATELLDTATATGSALMDLGAATVSATLHSTELTAKAAYITVDTVDYGIKATIDAMPADAEDLVERGAVLISAVMYDLDSNADADKS